MKKRALAALLISGMVLGLAGCGGSEKETSMAVTEIANTDAVEIQATTWAPTAAVSIIVPADAGGNIDLSARIFAQYAKDLTGHDFIVVNAGDAAESAAAEQVLSADADGHTFLYGYNFVNVANIAGDTDYNYSAFKLGPTFAKDPAQGLYVNPEKYADLDAFIEAAIAAPGQLKASCTEVGEYSYYEILGFEKRTGIDLDVVETGSDSSKIAAVLSGQADLMSGAYINCKDYLATGQLICIGVPTVERYDLISGIPTLSEQGVDLVYPDCNFSFFFPAGTSDDAIIFYENLVQLILANPEAREAVKNVELMPYYLDSLDSNQNEENDYNIIKSIADA